METDMHAFMKTHKLFCSFISEIPCNVTKLHDGSDWYTQIP